jgi:hypothetical protein
VLGSSLLLWRTSGSGSEKQIGIASVPVQSVHYKLQGLSEPVPMTAPVPFWMEGNSSIDFGLANHLQQFHFAQF